MAMWVILKFWWWTPLSPVRATLMKPPPRLRHVLQDTLEDAQWMFLLSALFLAAPKPFLYCESEFLVLESQHKIFTLIKARGQDFNPIPCLGRGGGRVPLAVPLL